MRRKTCQDVSQFVDVDLIRARKLLILLDRFLRRRSAHRSVTRLLQSARHMRRPGDLLKIPAGSTDTHKQQHLNRSVPLFLAPLDRVVAAVLRHAGVAASVCGENHVDSAIHRYARPRNHGPCTPVAPVDILQPQPKLKNAFTSAATATAASDSSRAADLQGEAEGGPGSSADPLGRGAFPLAIIPKKTAHAT